MLEYCTKFWNDSEKQASFIRFIKQIHNLDLSQWKEASHWDEEHYIPFSFFDASNEVVSTVNLFILGSVIDDAQGRLYQFSGVGTAAEYRRQGLARTLSHRAMNYCSDLDGGFLFADEEAKEFYEDLGFIPTMEYQYSIPKPAGKSQKGLMQLDLKAKKDHDTLVDLVQNRVPVSNKFSVNNSKLVLFHALYSMQGGIYFISPLATVVFAKRTEHVLTICDIVAPEIHPFEVVYEFLPDSLKDGVEEIIFSFIPDKLGLGAELRIVEDGSNNLYVTKTFPNIEGIRIPYTAHA